MFQSNNYVFLIENCKNSTDFLLKEYQTVRLIKVASESMGLQCLIKNRGEEWRLWPKGVRPTSEKEEECST